MTAIRFRALRRQLKVMSLRAIASLPRPLRDAVILSSIKAEEESLGETVVKIAETDSEHLQASALLFEAYADDALVEQRGVPVRVTPFLMVPSTVRFVALVRGEVVATLSLVQDSGLGLPLERAFGPQIQSLRASAGRLAEVGALAVKRGHRGHGLTMLLYKAMWQVSELLGVHELVAAVRPDLEVFYAAALRFTRLTDTLVRYPGINGDAVALRLNLLTARQRFREVFGASLEARRFNPLRFFLQTTHSNLQVPRSLGALAPLQRAHQSAALRLAWLRPEAVLSLAPREFEALGEALRARPLLEQHR